MDMLINWWIIGAVSILCGQHWYELSMSRMQAIFVGFVAGLCSASILDLGGWL